METQSAFLQRVREGTGYELREIPQGFPGDLGGHIIARRGDVYVVAVGYPDTVDDDGIEYWYGLQSFRRVNLEPSEECPSLTKADLLAVRAAAWEMYGVWSAHDPVDRPEAVEVAVPTTRGPAQVLLLPYDGAFEVWVHGDLYTFELDS